MFIANQPRAITGPEEAALDTDRQWSSFGLVIHPATVVVTARVATTPTSLDHLVQIAYNALVGTLADVLPGMTLWIGTMAGSYNIGMVRIRKAPDGTYFYIGEQSAPKVAAGQYLTVIDEMGVWTKAPFLVDLATGTIKEDYDIAYTNQHTNRNPIPVLGPNQVLDYRGNNVTAVFDARDSWVPGGGSATFVWTAPGAVATTGLTSAQPTMTYSAEGTYRVKCVVTIGGVSSIAYRYVYVVDPDNWISQFSFTAASGTAESGGWNFDVIMYAQASRATIRDKAYVSLVSLDYAAGTHTEQGYVIGRENILASGWIYGESIDWNPDYGTVTFQVQGLRQWLGRIPSFALGLYNTLSTPDRWVLYQGLNFQAAIWHFLYWRTTLPAMADCLVEPNTWSANEFTAPVTMLWEQLTAYAKLTILATPLVDRYGRLFVIKDSQIQADRTGYPTIMTIDSNDWVPALTLRRDPFGQISMVYLNGASLSGATPTAIFALSPGHAYDNEGGEEHEEGLVLPDQATALQLAGLMFGWRNNEYPSIIVNLAGNNRFFDIVPPMYAHMVIQPADTVRGISFDGRVIPRSITHTWDAATGMLLSRIEFEAETFEQNSTIGDPPVAPPVPEPVPPPPDSCPVGYHFDTGTGTCVPDSPGTAGDPNNAVGFTTAHFGFTMTALSGSPNWFDRTGSFTGSIVSACLYSFDAANVALVLTTTKLYLVKDLQSPSFTWTALLDISDFTFTNGSGPITLDHLDYIHSPITDPNRLWLGATGTNGTVSEAACYAILSVDVGAGTAAIVAQGVHSGANGAFNEYLVRRIISDFSDGDAAYTAVMRDGGSSNWQSIRNAGGGVISRPSTHTFVGQPVGLDMDIDYPSRGATQYFLANAGGTYNLFRSTDFGANWTLVLSHIGGIGPSATSCRILINIATLNTLDVLVAFPMINVNDSAFYRSTDGGGTWTLVNTGAYGNNSGVMAVGRWPYDPNIVFFMGVGMYVTTDMFATAVLSMTGDWPTVMVEPGWPGNCNINVIPIWVSL